MSDPRPIGLFDSGVGGLTVLEAVARRMPFEDLLYLGDTARVTPHRFGRLRAVRQARRAIGFLLAQSVKAVVVACNTASALALDAIEEMSPVPVVGVVAPGGAPPVVVLTGTVVGVVTPVEVLAGFVVAGALSVEVPPVAPDAVPPADVVFVPGAVVGIEARVVVGLKVEFTGVVVVALAALATLAT